MTGKPNSLTNTAFQTGVICERARIIAIIQNKARTTEAPARLLSELTLILAEIKGETK